MTDFMLNVAQSECSPRVCAVSPRPSTFTRCPLDVLFTALRHAVWHDGFSFGRFVHEFGYFIIQILQSYK